MHCPTTHTSPHYPSGVPRVRFCPSLSAQLYPRRCNKLLPLLGGPLGTCDRFTPASLVSPSVVANAVVLLRYITMKARCQGTTAAEGGETTEESWSIWPWRAPFTQTFTHVGTAGLGYLPWGYEEQVKRSEDVERSKPMLHHCLDSVLKAEPVLGLHVWKGSNGFNWLEFPCQM